jgi:hypothetical protein
MSKLISKRQNTEVGLALEFVGFILLFFPPIGAIFGFAFLILSYIKSKKFICSECGNKIKDKNVKICPVCKASF